MVTETNAPGAYCTATRDGRWSVTGTVTSGTRREWLRMMAAMSGAALVDGLLPRGLARAATRRVAQQQDPLAAFRARIGPVPIQAQPLAENLTLLSGPGGNVVVLRGADGLVMVDTFVSPAWPKLQESLKGLGAPVKFVINTHWHFDHTDNNAPLRAAGATLVAPENPKLRMTQPHHLALPARHQGRPREVSRHAVPGCGPGTQAQGVREIAGRRHRRQALRRSRRRLGQGDVQRGWVRQGRVPDAVARRPGSNGATVATTA